MLTNRFIFTDLIAKLAGLGVAMTMSIDSAYVVGSVVYFAITMFNHAVHGSENKSLVKLLPIAFFGWVINFFILAFFMAPIITHTKAVLQLSLILSLHGFVNIAMWCDTPEEILTRYFSLKPSFKSIN